MAGDPSPNHPGYRNTAHNSTLCLALKYKSSFIMFSEGFPCSPDKNPSPSQGPKAYSTEPLALSYAPMLSLRLKSCGIPLGCSNALTLIPPARPLHLVALLREHFPCIFAQLAPSHLSGLSSRSLPTGVVFPDYLHHLASHPIYSPHKIFLIKRACPVLKHT